MLLQAACHSRECLIANSGSFYTTDPGSTLDQPDQSGAEFAQWSQSRMMLSEWRN